MIWFTSDLHFGHENVLRHQERPWGDIEAMNRGLIANINATVGMNDTLYVLGDFSFKIKQAEAWELRKQIICRNVHLIRGNHDCGWNGTNAFKSVSDYLELKEEGYRIVLSHYPFLEWNGSRRSWSVHLHGHQHNDADYNIKSIEDGTLRFDVGVDANDFKPVSLDDVFAWAELARENRNGESDEI